VGENAIVIVELDVPAGVAISRATEVADWLLAEGVVVRNDKRRPAQPSEFLPGPQSSRVAPDTAARGTLLNSGVDIIAERAFHHPVENYEPPPCPVCGAPIDPDLHLSLLGQWLSGDEPSVTCQSCNASSRIGDWVSEYSYYVGNLAIRFNNWTRLADTFTGDLGARLGSRWRVVYEYS
jgi:hypothetical protein